MKQKKIIDMTQGNIYSLLIQFAVPLILGNLFQMLYNFTDTWVLGNFASNEEYAAVGSTTFILNLIIKGFIGLSSGMSIIVGRYFGAGQKDLVRRASQNAGFITIFCCVFFTILGLAIIPGTLRISKVPDEICEYTSQYLRIIFGFVSVQIIYNMGAAILRAVGDSRKPFYFLVVAAVINIVLDLYFVIKLNLGVKGVAYATVIAQCVAAILTVAELFKTPIEVNWGQERWKLDPKIIKDMIWLGIPTALQSSITSFGNIFVQSYINGLGVDFLSGFATYHKVEELLFTAANSLGIASMTFASQNLGAGDIRRAKEGTNKNLILTLSYTSAMAILVVVFAPQVCSVFNSDEQVVYYGSMALRVITPFFFCIGSQQVQFGALRAAGKSTQVMLAQVGANVVYRLIYLKLITTYVEYNPVVVLLSYPTSWIIGSAVCTAMYVRTFHNKD